MTDHVRHIVPVTLREARAFVEHHHRHRPPPQGGLFAIGLATVDDLIGVAIVGMPVARHMADGYTAEVTRLAVLEGNRNGCSMLYGAAWRAARAMGYRRLITYTLASEPGSSLRGAGWREVASVRARSWHTPTRPRDDKHPALQLKVRWEKP